LPVAGEAGSPSPRPDWAHHRSGQGRVEGLRSAAVGYCSSTDWATELFVACFPSRMLRKCSHSDPPTRPSMVLFARGRSRAIRARSP